MPIYHFVNKYLGLEIPNHEWFLDFPVVIMTSAWFGVIKYICTKESTKIIKLSKLTFGVYLIHNLIMRMWIWKWPIIEQMTNYYLQTFAIYILSVVFSFLVVWLISKLPFSKYVIGV